MHVCWNSCSVKLRLMGMSCCSVWWSVAINQSAEQMKSGRKLTVITIYPGRDANVRTRPVHLIQSELLMYLTVRQQLQPCGCRRRDVEGSQELRQCPQKKSHLPNLKLPRDFTVVMNGWLDNQLTTSGTSVVIYTTVKTTAWHNTLYIDVHWLSPSLVTPPPLSHLGLPWPDMLTH